jgi:hypothetical protein
MDISMHKIMLALLFLSSLTFGQTTVVKSGEYKLKTNGEVLAEKYSNTKTAVAAATKISNECHKATNGGLCPVNIFQPTITVITIAASSSSKSSSSAQSSVAPVPVVSVSSAPSSVLWSADFSDGKVLGIAQLGASATVVDGAYKLSYPKTTEGKQFSWLNYDAPPNTKQLYISFKAKMPANKAGLKFVKIFGKRDGDLYSNTTFALDYTGIDEGVGSLYAISFGDGTDRTNDSQNVIFLDGSYPQYIGRSYGKTAIVKTPMKKYFRASAWGTDWHQFKMMVKFNDGTSKENEVPNGGYFLSIDGNTYVDASGLFNRNYSSQDISHVEFGGWAQGSRGIANPAFDIYYDDIVISSGGWVQ